MSVNYHACQYNEPFKPKHLRNWRLGTNPYPGKFAGCVRQCPTTFIANDNGHLFPHIARNGCTSPWGDYRTSIWEEKTPCACIDMLRNPREYTKPRNMILVTHEVPCPQVEAKGVCGALNESQSPVDGDESRGDAENSNEAEPSLSEESPCA